jgi:4-nitrophenyl phosphatase
MRRAATLVRGGARLVATNDDGTYPTPEGPIPGAGSILASIETAAGTSASVAGKPHPPMADLVRSHVGAEGWVVGDRPETDGRFAEVLGFRFGLVLTGVTRPDDLPVTPEPEAVADDLLTLVAEQHRVRS